MTNTSTSSSGVPAMRPFTRIKVLTIGDSCTGKSCLIKRYCERKFIPRYISTIGLDYGVRQHTPAAGTSGSGSVRVNLYDVSGSRVYDSVRAEFYSDSEAVLVCYDVNNRPSFQHVGDWLTEALAHTDTHSGSGRPVLCLCGTMANETNTSTTATLDGGEDDGLSSKRPRAVTEAEGAGLAAKHGALFFECSAKTGYNVSQLFESVFDTVMSKSSKAFSASGKR